MATSIFFTETRDFKLIKSQVLSQEDSYLVYVYADTSNVKIPKELIKELPVYGNSLIWVDTADYDSTDIANHMILMIGQYVNSEEEITFYIASRSAKITKTIYFLRNLGIPVELITSTALIPETKGGKKRKTRKSAPVDEAGEPIKKRKPGRPKKSESTEVINETDKPEKKKRGRKPGSKKTKEPKVAKMRKPRTEKVITDDEVNAKLDLYPNIDWNTKEVLRFLFKKQKVARPKLEVKLNDTIKEITNESELVAEQIINQMKEMGLLEIGISGRLKYQD